MKQASPIQKIALLLFGLLICVILIEAGMRTAGFVFLWLQEHKNRLSIAKQGACRILCIGESTTALGGQYSYPRQLEEVLNSRARGKSFTVINRGLPAANTGYIVSHLEENLDRYRPDVLVVMMGINDVWAGVPYENRRPGTIASFFKSLRTYKLLLHLQESVGGAMGVPCRDEAADVVAPGAPGPGRPAGGDAAPAPGSDGAYVGAGWSSWDRGEYAAAARMFEKALAINPRNDRAYVGLGWAYWGLRDSGRAEQAVRKALEINPRSDEAYLALGWGYRYPARKQHAEAVAMLEKAVEINPGNERACDMLGRCYKEEGKLDAARALFERVIELNPRDSSAYGLLGHCYRELGQRKKSEECFRTASALRSEYYNPVTRRNYERLREIVSRRGITLVCAQYPLRNVEPLKQMFADTRGIIFVDNEAVFRDALKNGRYEDYFTDTFAGDFGHCTPRGNRLLAENLATAVLRDRP